jgi:hypothetical protein
MDVQKEQYYSLNDMSVYMRSFFNYLLRKWVGILLFLFLGTGIGVFYYFNQKPKYTAVTTFILEEKSSSNGLAGLASQFGFNVGSLSGGGSIFSGDNILEILKSKKVVQKVLLDKVGGTLANNNQTLIDYYLDFTGAHKKWMKSQRLAGINFSVSAGQFDAVHDSVLNSTYEHIVKKSLLAERLSKQGTIIKVQVTEADPLFARMMSERLVEEAGKLYLDIRTGAALANIQQLQNRSDSLLYLLNRKSYTAAASQPLDVNPGIKTAAVPLEIASRDKTVLATLYAEITKNLEASKLILSQQTPVIQQLDTPPLLLNDEKKGLVFLAVAFGLGFVFGYIVWLFVKFFLNKINQQIVHSNTHQ